MIAAYVAADIVQTIDNNTRFALYQNIADPDLAMAVAVFGTLAWAWCSFLVFSFDAYRYAEQCVGLFLYEFVLQ